MSGERAKFLRHFFPECTGLWTTECWLAHELRQLRPPPPWTSVFFSSLFLVTLEKLGFVNQNGLECDLSALLLRALAMGRRQISVFKGLL